MTSFYLKIPYFGHIGRLRMRWSNLFSAAILCLPCTADASWELESSKVLAEKDGVRHIEASFSREREKAEMHLILFDSKKHDIAIVDNSASAFGSIADAMRSGDLIAGINGGYFHPDFEPLGLLVADGELLHKQQKASLLSGIVAANKKKIYLLRPNEFRLGPHTMNALQAGPFLVDGGTRVDGLDDSKSARRSVIMHDGGRVWAIASISPLTLEETARLLADKAIMRWISPQRALNLDGGSSSTLWFSETETTKPFHMRSLTKVRNFIGIKKR